jgi:cobalamin biosynthesis Mg chelatase CobN
MKLTLKQLAALLGLCVLLAMFTGFPLFGAEDHVVSSSELQQQAVAATNTRQQNADTVTRFMSSPKAQQELQTAHVSPTEVKSAISKMSDEEVAQLAQRVDKTQADFAAGGMSDRAVILLVIAIIVLVLIIVAVR